MEKTRLTFIEAFSMKRLGEEEKLIIQVVAKLVQKGSEKGSERNYPSMFHRAHPNSNFCESPSLNRLVETMQFSPLSRRSNSKNAYPRTGCRETDNDMLND